jgi:hypothetical protein
MKITKSKLKQLIKEELGALLEAGSEDFYGTDPEEEGGRQLEVPKPGETQAPMGMAGDPRYPETQLRLRTIKKAKNIMWRISHHLTGGAPGRDPDIADLRLNVRRVIRGLTYLIDNAARYELRE